MFWRSTSTRFARSVVLSFVLLSVFAVAMPQRAAAGSNGQQVSVNAPWFTLLEEVYYVTGTNQNGHVVTWYKAGPTTRARTDGWWWVGQITVKVRVNGRGWVTCIGNVPKSQWFSDWYGITCPTS